MARYKITLAYDGAAFLGFQRQRSGRTVQAEVESALRQLNWPGRAILAAGRTDTGVHAAGQVIAIDLDWVHEPADLGRALNARLPEDIAVREVVAVTGDFHPRYDARVRSYHYQIYCQPERDPLRARYAWRVWPEAKLDLMQAAARLFPGAHDFAAFGTPSRSGGSTVRLVYKAGWTAQVNGLLFEVSANGFLYHMVRRLVFLQVLVGQGLLKLEALQSAIADTQPMPPGLAPPHGLVLSDVRYTLNEQENQVLINADGQWKTWSASGEDDSGKDLRH
ncbi:MAG TPA: tRNA pseudouridine(38-40) synthase TruA [Levilinea sp.]|nr:tRNA pseudouridine(38-40) synthase TruA [Levilinea sp.]